MNELIYIIESSQNHRMAWAERDYNDHRVSTPCYVHHHQPPDQAAQSHIQLGRPLQEKSLKTTKPFFVVVFCLCGFFLLQHFVQQSTPI